jgi:uncharacterized protein YciI
MTLQGSNQSWVKSVASKNEEKNASLPVHVAQLLEIWNRDKLGSIGSVGDGDDKLGSIGTMSSLQSLGEHRRTEALVLPRAAKISTLVTNFGQPWECV